MQSRRLFTSVTLTTALALVACSNSEPEQPRVVQSQIALTAFDSCSELETYLEDSTIREINVHLDNLKEFRYWWGGPGFDVFAERGGVPVPATDVQDDSGNSAPTDYTQTNTQVEGVDEADFVKTNGTHIFALSGTKLYMTRSWPAESMEIVDSITIEGWPQASFLDENGNVVVFSYYYPNLSADDLFYCSWGCYNRTMTKITVLSTEGDTLTPIHQVYMQGAYANARRIGSSVRVVMRDHLPMPEGVRWYPENFNDDPAENLAEWAIAIERLKSQNAALIRAQTLDDLLPQNFYIDQNGARVDLPRNCASFSRANVSVRTGVATIGTVNLLNGSALNGGLSMSTTSILGQVGHLYASTEALYIATPHWWWWPEDSERNFTYLHKFDITNPNVAVYRASGAVAGVPLNQFAMDEYDGNFRVATTIDEWTHQGSDEWDFSVRTFNRVSVLDEIDGELKVIGQTRELAERERITSARFIKEKAYLVTFERIDPLFTLDLTDPTSPQIVGELKIPGFSTYLHPLDDNHLLAIGVDLPEPDADGRVDWSQRAMKLSIFDVSNLAEPREKFTRRIGTAYGWSEAAWDHRAFNYFAARKTLAIPFSDYLPGTVGDAYWRRFVSDLRLFSIDVDTGITPIGSMSMADVYEAAGTSEWRWNWNPWVRRSVMADDIAYLISDSGIRAANTSSPAATLSTVLFDTATVR